MWRRAWRGSGRGGGGCAMCAMPPGLTGGHGEHGALHRRSPPSPQGADGAPRGALAFDAEAVMHRLEDAGRTLLSLPEGGHSTKLRTSRLDVVRTALES